MVVFGGGGVGGGGVGGGCDACVGAGLDAGSANAARSLRTAASTSAAAGRRVGSGARSARMSLCTLEGWDGVTGMVYAAFRIWSEDESLNGWSM